MATSASQSSRNLRGFIRWMRENGVEYSDALSFHVGDTVADIGVKALYDLHEGEIIAAIPKQACLTTLTSAASEMIAEAELSGGLGLAVALMYERSIGELSKWYGYLKLLPFQQCLPFVWGLSEIDWLLVGTELHKVIKEDKRLIKQDWRECYRILSDLHGEDKFPAKWFSFDHYLAAKTLVASRAFEVDDFQGFGMVPLADLFNHKTAAEDVHFTSVLSDSESDTEEDRPTSPASARESPTSNGNKKGKFEPTAEEQDVVGSPSDWEGSREVLEIIMVKDVLKGAEIYNTYGSLSNAALLHSYGFTELNNPFDIVNVDLALVIDVCGRSFSLRHIRRCITVCRKAGCAPCSSQGAEYYEISAGGRPQLGLLMLLYLVHLPDATRDKLDQQAIQWNPEANISNSEADGAESAAVEGLARVLGWTSRPEKSSSRTRDRDSQTKGLFEGPTQTGSNNGLRHQKTPVWLKEEDPRWLTDLNKWLLTKPVCTSLLEILIERDNLYPAMNSISSEKVIGDRSSSTLEQDVALLQALDSKGDVKLCHALSLRVSERTILETCVTYLRTRLNRT